MKPLIQMVGITKVFPGVKALNNISFDILPGEVHVLVGENGAGKSTLMKILSGVYKPTEGMIVCGDHTYSALSTKDSYDEGIAVVYQELSVINELSILENLFVGKLPTKKVCGLPVVDYRLMEKKAADILAKVGLNSDPKTTMVGDLAMPDKQLCEIAKALISGAKTIVLDEPTTSLTTNEVENLHKLIRQLKAEGCGIVYISHKMNELKAIGDRITVLKDGGYMGTFPAAGITLDELVKRMVGREVSGTYLAGPDADLSHQPVIFEAKGITRADGKCRDISFQLHRGEILGFAGLVGAGRTEVMEAIFGAVPKSSGEVYLNGKALRIRKPYDAIKNGLGMLTEDRRKTGFANNFSCAQNISLVPFIKSSSAGGLSGMISPSLEKRWSKEQIKALHIKCTSPAQKTYDLSGGNQQKVILGKWLAAESDVLIFDEPTKGIDVGSKSEIYVLMRQLANQGKGVLMVSSEQTELLSACDRIAVFREGKLRQTLDHAEASEEAIVRISTNE